ncbi:hypothetical protein [Bosea lathyri]|uniref:Uncharacterized protein n=1 Tax=Bosea lathyri TaxID=1036778 RepID=A0A1H5SRK7_9HYPH|nr:hypothetical protein [Bosea lathyri]SEF53189.1 hypothetical protein SAMN04488115_101388 [Bosea lathyri]
MRQLQNRGHRPEADIHRAHEYGPFARQFLKLWNASNSLPYSLFCGDREADLALSTFAAIARLVRFSLAKLIMMLDAHHIGIPNPASHSSYP